MLLWHSWSTRRNHHGELSLEERGRTVSSLLPSQSYVPICPHLPYIYSDSPVQPPGVLQSSKSSCLPSFGEDVARPADMSHVHMKRAPELEEIITDAPMDTLAVGEVFYAAVATTDLGLPVGQCRRCSHVTGLDRFHMRRVSEDLVRLVSLETATFRSRCSTRGDSLLLLLLSS